MSATHRVPAFALSLAVGAVAVGASAVALGQTAPTAEEPEACRLVRMSDPGWTDITSTNAVLGALLEALG